MARIDKKYLKNQTVSVLSAIIPGDPRIDRGGNPVGLVILLLVGIIGIVIMLVALKTCVKHPEPVAVMSTPLDCRECHGPIAKNYREYKRFQRARVNYDKLVLADLARPVKRVRP